MSDTTTTRFRMKKTVGSPSVDGASGIETLASHTNNPSAHPDYMKKGALPAYFSGSEHLTDKLAHCAYYARRSEVMTSKLDYEQTKNMSLTNDASNYAATSGVKRYILTSYVLNLILAANGFDGSKTYIETNKIVTSMGTVPVGYEAHYVIGYPLFKNLYDLVSVINANYLTVAVANSLYSPIDHVHEVTEVRGAMNVLGYSYTGDTTFASGKNYYKYDPTTHHLVLDTTVVVGETIPANTYFEKDSEKYAARGHEHDILDINGSTAVLGYFKTSDTVVVANKTYYRYNPTTKQMYLWTPGAVGTAIPDPTFEKTPRTTRVLSSNPSKYTGWIVENVYDYTDNISGTDIACKDYVMTIVDTDKFQANSGKVGTLFLDFCAYKPSNGVDHYIVYAHTPDDPTPYNRGSSYSSPGYIGVAIGLAHYSFTDRTGEPSPTNPAIRGTYRAQFPAVAGTIITVRRAGGTRLAHNYTRVYL